MAIGLNEKKNLYQEKKRHLNSEDAGHMHYV